MGQEAQEPSLATTHLVEAATAPAHHIHDLVMAHLHVLARTSIIIVDHHVGEDALLGKMFHLVYCGITHLLMLH